MREAIDTQNLFLLNSETISCQSKPKRGNFRNKIVFVCGRQKTSRPEQKENRRAATAWPVITEGRWLEKKEKPEKEREREREKRKLADRCVATATYGNTGNSGILHWI